MKDLLWILPVIFLAIILRIVELDKKKSNFIVTADTNVSQTKGLSKYVTQEEIYNFAVEHWAISNEADHKDENETQKALRHLLETRQTDKVLEFLKDNNLSADTKLQANTTPLMYSAFYNDENTTKELIKLGANIRAKDNYKLSPMAYAIENNATKVVKILFDNGVKFDEVEVVQWGPIDAPLYTYWDRIILDDNGNTEYILKDEKREFVGGSAVYLFDVLINSDLYEIAEMVLESGYKPYLFFGEPKYGMYRYTNSLEDMFAGTSIEKIYNRSNLNRSIFSKFDERRVSYKPMLNLLLKYVEFVPNEETLKFFKEEYENCHRNYQNLIHDKISYLYKIVDGKDKILQDYLVYKYAKEKGLKAKKLENELDRKNQYANPYDYILRKLKENNTIVKLELKPNPYIIEQYDEEINLYGKYCGDDSLDYKVDFENFNKEDFIKFYQNFRIIKSDENLTFKDISQYLEYKNETETFGYTKWFQNIDKYVRDNRDNLIPNTRLFLKDKNMTYFEYTEKYKKGEIVLDENSFIDKRLKSAKTEDEKQFFGISNIDREEVLKLENEFYERKF
ncbi:MULTISPECIES: ankyrin repeat domain-containing protein [unclassified Campylobacter]|uniref:ankyrin repeat domain-containing protein n=1 Tax=unclassified Campylobacter TaxID=2593542 RepID=UPI0022E9B97E|nr:MULTISPECIES: ankyrin repeat domain-containing protein [unclassified Campylobacter]MDA3062844.1 ankyrin repeat domain-containing protein [Campylobacter sp. JMF_14 EL1]MDA3073738.1 ankyrin repeat domain-containing protein [Campylobacter sp. JMF_10 EL2]